MEARTGLVIGGATAVAASIAVVTAVALANTAALADAPGTSVASEPIVIPSAGSPSATPQPTATIAPPVEAPAAAVAGPEVVEAPAPVVVDASRTIGDAGSPSAPVTAPPPAPPVDLEAVIAASRAAGNWDAVRDWAAANGWPAGRTDALVKRLESERAAESNKLVAPSAPADSVEQRRSVVVAEPEQRQATVVAEPEQRSVDIEVESGPIEAEQDPATTPGKPAHAGSNVEHGNGAAHGEKKGQSRNPPDKRD